MKPCRVLVADSLPMFRVGISRVLTREGDFEVVEADSLEQVARAIESAPPDIALIDLDLPPRGGVEAVSRLAPRSQAHLIVWSFAPTRRAVLDAVRAGASGYLRKEISPHGLVRSLRGVLQGEAPLSRDLAALMIEALQGYDEQTRAREKTAVLSSREREVLDLVARGARNKQIASKLAISEFTVKRHVQNILEKLEVPSRSAAASFYAMAFGAGELDVPSAYRLA